MIIEKYKQKYGQDVIDVLYSLQQLLFFLNFSKLEIDFYIEDIIINYIPFLLEGYKSILEFVIIIFHSLNNDQLYDYIIKLIYENNEDEVDKFLKSVYKLKDRIILGCSNISGDGKCNRSKLNIINKNRRKYYRTRETTVVFANNKQLLVKTIDLIYVINKFDFIFVDDILLKQNEVKRLRNMLSF